MQIRHAKATMFLDHTGVATGFGNNRVDVLGRSGREVFAKNCKITTSCKSHLCFAGAFFSLARAFLPDY